MRPRVFAEDAGSIVQAASPAGCFSVTPARGSRLEVGLQRRRCRPPALRDDPDEDPMAFRSV